MSIAEFTVHRSWQSDRRSPLRWLWSYVRRNPIWILALLIGAFGNAVLASVVPLEAGRAFNALQSNPDNTQALLVAAVATNITANARGAESERLARMGRSRLAPLALRPPSSVAKRIVRGIER